MIFPVKFSPPASSDRDAHKQGDEPFQRPVAGTSLVPRPCLPDAAEGRAAVSPESLAPSSALPSGSSSRGGTGTASSPWLRSPRLEFAGSPARVLEQVQTDLVMHTMVGLRRLFCQA